MIKEKPWYKKLLPSSRKNTEVMVRPNEPDPPTLELSPLGILAGAVKDKAGLEIIERLMELKNKEEDRQAKKAYFAALSRFQAECPEIEKNSPVYNNNHSLRYKYAKIGQIIKQVKEPLGANGLSFSMKYEPRDEGINIICLVHHIDGHTEPTETFMPIDAPDYMKMSDQQKIGMAHTYGDRYCISGALGIVTMDMDTDGNTEKEIVPRVDFEVLKYACIGLLASPFFTQEEREAFKERKRVSLQDWIEEYENLLQSKIIKTGETTGTIKGTEPEEKKKQPQKFEDAELVYDNTKSQKTDINQLTGKNKILAFVRENQTDIMAAGILPSSLFEESKGKTDDEIDDIIKRMEEEICQKKTSK